MRRGVLSLLISMCCVAIAAVPSFAQRPVTPTLLPETTVAMIRINNVPEMIEKGREGNLGRMLADPEIAPFAQSLYGSGAEAFKQVEAELGVSLDDLMNLPQGEICVALCSTEQGPPAFVLLFEAVNKLDVFDKLVARAEKEMLKEGGDFKKKTETVGSTEITILEAKDEETPDFVYFKKEGVFSVITNIELAKNMLSIWEGIPLPAPKTTTTSENPEDAKPSVATPLASDKLYNAVMARCGLNDPDPPHITYYARPLEIIKSFMNDNLVGRLAFNSIVPQLGLDKLLAVGGSITLGAGDFDSIQQLHVLIDNPRKGILEAIALEPGEVTPEKFVPRDCVTYMTFNVNVQKSFTAVESVVDGFRGEGSLLSMMKNNLSTPTGVDFELDILANLANRGTYFQWVERPVKLNSQRTVVAFHLKDVTLAAETLLKFAEKFPERIETATFEDVTYYKVIPGERREPRTRPGVELTDEQRQLRIDLQPIPAWGIIENCLVITDRPTMFEKCLVTTKDSSAALISDPKFKAVAENVNKYMKGGKPAAFMFQRPEESFRFMYDLANEQSSRDFLQTQGESNPFFGAVNKAMTDSPLPPFSKIEQYMAPAGSLILSDETGFHLFGFSMKPETAEPKKK
jgi:hypothetical protein